MSAKKMRDKDPNNMSTLMMPSHLWYLVFLVMKTLNEVLVDSDLLSAIFDTNDEEKLLL